MPATYAHRRFGAEIYERLPENLKGIVSREREVFDIGLHGPDIFFYYKVLKKNPVNAHGNEMHDEKAGAFFGPAREAYLSSENREASLSYLLGFLCHYALDSACHPYIENKIRVSGITHAEIESEFERFLLEKDGKDPLSAVTYDHVHATDENAAKIAPFFPMFTAEQIRETLRSMCYYCEWLRTPYQPKRGFVRFVLRLSGHYGELKGQVMAKKPIEGCRDSSERLFKLYKKAQEHYPVLADAYTAYLENGRELSSLFDLTFGPNENWETIPVLSYEEELSYTV